MADWITIPIGERCPGAETCLDPFHIVKLSTDALDEVRRRGWDDTRKAGQRGLARELKGARFALWMNPGAAHRTITNDTGRSSPACRRSTRTCTAPTPSPNSCG